MHYKLCRDDVRINNMRTGYNELLEFIGEDWQVFGTLSFKHRQTYEQAEKTLKYFWNCIDRIFYGNASYRKHIRTKRANVIQQGSTRQNTHIHFVAKTVKGFNINDFIEILNRTICQKNILLMKKKNI